MHIKPLVFTKHTNIIVHSLDLLNLTERGIAKAIGLAYALFAGTIGSMLGTMS